MASYLAEFMLEDSQAFMSKYSHNGDFVACQQKLSNDIENFDISAIENSFPNFSETRLPEFLQDKNFLAIYSEKLLREFWLRPQLLQTRKKNTAELLSQMLKINKIIRRILADTYEQLDPPEEAEKRLIAKIKDELLDKIVAHIDGKFENLMEYFEGSDNENEEKSVASEISEPEYIEKNYESETDGKINVEIPSGESDNENIAPEETAATVTLSESVPADRRSTIALAEPVTINTSVVTVSTDEHSVVETPNDLPKENVATSDSTITIDTSELPNTPYKSEQDDESQKDVNELEKESAAKIQPTETPIIPLQSVQHNDSAEVAGDDLPPTDIDGNDLPMNDIGDTAIDTAEPSVPKKKDRHITIRRFGKPNIYAAKHSIL